MQSSIAKVTKHTASATNSTAKTLNSTANGTRSTARVTDSLEKLVNFLSSDDQTFLSHTLTCASWASDVIKMCILCTGGVSQTFLNATVYT